MKDKRDLLVKLDFLEHKIETVLQELHSAKTELVRIKGENQDLKAIIERQNQEIKNFQNQEKISKIVSSIAEDAHNPSELKLKINEYIREIDKCIAHLSE
jgi:hypothetical protein